MRFRLAGFLALVFVFTCVASAVAQDDLRDVVLKTNGDEVRGRVVQRYDDEQVIVQQGGRLIEIKRKDVSQIVFTVRDQLREFLSQRKPRLTLDQEWALVASAQQLALPRMAELQAWHVLTLDPRHEGANELLGHRRKGRLWQWKQGRRFVTPEAYEENIQKWGKHLILESENYRLETDTNISLAVNLLFDLERTYVFWMDRLGASLQAAELALDRNHRMVVQVFADPEENAFPRWGGSDKEAFYSPSLEYRTQKGDPNVIFTYPDGRDARPVRFFELATQQLLYTTLVFGRRTGDAPATEQARFAHWAELGIGYWFGRQLFGPLGYARERSFLEDSSVMRYARMEPPRDSPLDNARYQVTNLIGLPFRSYHGSNKVERERIHQGKAKAFFTFLMSENPKVLKRGKVVGEGREALFHYLHAVFATPRGHSSSAFDKVLEPGRVEDLEEPWMRWMFGG